MVPPKATKSSPKAAKSSPKPSGGAAPATKSVFAAMRAEAKLAKHMAKAKTVVATREFDGPDGDYNANLNRVSHYKKDGNLGVIFEFRCVDEGDYEEQKMLVFFIFKTDEYNTIEEIQNQFFETLQLLGIDTNVDDSELDKALNELITSKSVITLRVKSNKAKTRKYTSVVGVASAANEIEDTEYQEDEIVDEETTEVEDEETTEVADEETTEEWNEDEVPEEEEVVEEVEEESDPSLPSSWVGYAMIYKGEEIEVVDADDATMKAIITYKGKKLKVAFATLTPPTE